MPDSAVVARGRAKAVERGTVGSRRRVRQPLAAKPNAKSKSGKSSTATSGKTTREKISDSLKAAEEREAPLYASPEEVAVFAQGLKEAYLYCRTLGHNWKSWSARFENGGWEVVLRCNRCTCRREQLLSATGSVLSNKYLHPDGYLHEGMGRIVSEGRDALRLESVKRTSNSKVRAA